MSATGTVVHEEVSHWPLWVSLLVWGACLGGAVVSFAVLRDPLQGGDPVRALGGAAAVLLVPLAILLFFGRLRIRVTRTALRITIGYTPLVTKVVKFEDILGMEPVRYSPLREFGGWGIRRSFRGGKQAWTMRGNRALVLSLPEGTQLYVGSDDPERLASRIRLSADIPDTTTRNHD